jgi:cytidylate kinase
MQSQLDSGGGDEHVHKHLASALRTLSGHLDAGASPDRPPPPEPPTRFTIALSRQAGTPASTIAREVGQRLGWAVYDRELLDRIAADQRWRLEQLERVDERHLGWLLETCESFLGVPLVAESAYVHQLVKTMLALSLRGECIIVGRGAAQRLPPSTTLRVRLFAPRRSRIVALAQQEGISEKQATRKVKELDREHRLFVRRNFFKDPGDPDEYDLVLNAARLPVPACTRLILEALSGMQASAAKPSLAIPAKT